ncbi:MAG: RhsIA family immunity protein [Azoarcus sp.]|nr:RhsIA family immunity protein [Azoarcus sp.]
MNSRIMPGITFNQDAPTVRRLIGASGFQSMDDFEISRYLVATTQDHVRSPVDTVLEYVSAYQKWARDCVIWVKQHREKDVSELDGEAHMALAQIQKKYCISKNRQWQRSGPGYFFYGGTYDIHPVVQSCEQQNKRLATVITEKRPRLSPSFRFSLERRGKVWLIASLDRLNGINQWEPDTL